MLAKKSHHYLPKFYLRNFALDDCRRLIALYNLPSENYVPETSIKHQGCSKYFYGVDGHLEDALQVLETKAAGVVRSIVVRDELPKLHSESHHMLVLFVVLQHSRTPYAAAEAVESANKIFRAIYADDPRLKSAAEEYQLVPKNAPQAAMSVSHWLFPVAFDLKYKLLKNKTPEPFITSDNPVIYYNQFLEKRRPYLSNTGLQSLGLQVFFPLSSTHCLLLYDDGIYKVGTKASNLVETSVREDVKALNTLQAISALDYLYFGEGVPEQSVIQLVRSARSFQQREKAFVKKYINTDTPGQTRELIQISRSEPRCDFRLSFISVHRRARKKNLPNTAALLRDPSMFDVLEEFERLVKDGVYRQEDFYPFLVSKGKVRIINR